MLRQTKSIEFIQNPPLLWDPWCKQIHRLQKLFAIAALFILSQLSLKNGNLISNSCTASLKFKEKWNRDGRMAKTSSTYFSYIFIMGYRKKKKDSSFFLSLLRSKFPICLYLKAEKPYACFQIHKQFYFLHHSEWKYFAFSNGHHFEEVQHSH